MTKLSIAAVVGILGTSAVVAAVTSSGSEVDAVTSSGSEVDAAVEIEPIAEPAPVITTDALVVYHCDPKSGSCAVCVDRICEKPGEQVFCCPKPGGDCIPAELMSSCDPATQYAVYCELGQSVPITNADGSAGFRCLE